MTYQETIDWMFSQLPMYQRQGKTAFKKDLTNISAFCGVLKEPTKEIRFYSRWWYQWKRIYFSYHFKYFTRSWL
jgi:hypothetical protein